MATRQQTNDFKINGTKIAYPPMPYKFIPPPISGYFLSGKPMRQGKAACIWVFRGKEKTVVLDELRGFLSNRSLDTEVTIRTFDPTLAGYQFSDFTAWMHLPEEEWENAILNNYTILFTNLSPA